MKSPFNILTYFRNRSKADDVMLWLANAVLALSIGYGFTMLTSFQIANGSLEELIRTRKEEVEDREYSEARDKRKSNRTKAIGSSKYLKIVDSFDSNGKLFSRIDTIELAY